MQGEKFNPVARGGTFRDPRWNEHPENRQVGVIAFYYPGREEVWDSLCGAGFLGNFHELGGAGLQLEAPCDPGRRCSFTNAEAAFQALKFWRMVDEFTGLTAREAFQKKKLLSGREDFTYGGFGSNWKGMRAVLRAKFQRGTAWADALIGTEDAFLLEHNAVAGRDQVWSDNSDGEGTNWLGLQLMLTRDELTSKSAWTSFIATSVNLETGSPITDVWQSAVRSACGVLKQELKKLPEDYGRTHQASARRASEESGGGGGALGAFRNAMGMGFGAPEGSAAAPGGDAGAADGAAAALGFARTHSASSASDEDEVEEASQALVPVSAAETVIHLWVRSQDGSEVRLPVRNATCLRVLMAAACSRLGLVAGQTQFRHRGREVLPLHTAEVLGLQDGDLLEADGPRIASGSPARGKGAAAPQRAARPSLKWTLLDLEWSCPSCGAEYPVSSEAVAAEPKQSCMRCGWQGYPEVQKRSLSEGERHAHRPLSSDLTMGRKAKTVASSGQVLDQDFEGQHVEAPLGGLLALVSQVQRERLSAGFVCYLLFCLCFIAVVTLGRPLNHFFEIQRSLHQQLILPEAPSPSGGAGVSFQEISDFGGFWSWVDHVLMEEVFPQSQPLGTAAALSNSSHFTIGRYNRLLTAIRFQQVRVRPTLPECTRLRDGSYPKPWQMACTTEEPFGHTESCGTPVHTHQLSRPCWGAFEAGYQDIAYPGAIQLETGAAEPPARDLQCLESCEAYHSRGLRTGEEWVAFSRSEVLVWVADFARVHALPQDALAACRGACDVSGSTFNNGLTHTAGHCGSSSGKPPHLVVADDVGCFGDVVDLPLRPAEARRRVDAMKRERWTNEGTRSLVVDVNTYNPNYDVATAVRVAVEVHPGGRLSPSVEMLSCRFRLYAGGVDSFRLFLEVLFSVWIFYYILIEVSEVYVQRWSYFAEAWNYVELANLAVYTYTTISWFVFINGPYSGIDAFKNPSPDTYLDLYTIATGFNTIALASFNLVYGFIRFTKYFRMSLKFKMLWDTLARAMGKVLPLLLIFAVLLTGFAWSGHWLFGHRVEGFETFMASVLLLLCSVKEGIDYASISEASPGVAGIWYLAWYVCSTLLFMNLLLTVVINNFARVKRQSEHNERIELAALEKSTRLPSLLLTWLRENTPLGLLRGGGNDKVSKEFQDNVAELTESLFEVDLEALWARLLEGISDDEVAVDAAELKFLFGGSQRKARLFINRVCNLAQLPRVEASDKPPTTEAILKDFETSAQALEAEIGRCCKDFEARYPALTPFLHPKEVSAEAQAEEAEGDADEGEEDADEVAELATKEQSPAGNARSEALYGTAIKAPSRGELRLAAAALDFRRQKRREGQPEPGDAPVPSADPDAVQPFDEDEGVQSRPAIAHFVQANRLTRR